MRSTSTSMTQDTESRRRFLKAASAVTAITSVATQVPLVHAADENTLQLALIGCGGRGTGATGDALRVDSGPLKLVAMADVFPAKLSASYQDLRTKFGERVDVPEDRRFVSFEGYKQAMDYLKKGDIVVLATPPAFRWPMFQYAIEKGLNVFMEKPVTVDAPTNRKMLELGKLAAAKNLKVGVGLMCRHCAARTELHKRIRDGAIGDIHTLRAYRMAGPTGSAVSNRRPPEIPEVLYQISRFHSFLWASGGAVSDFLIHNIDECCWMKDAWPVEAKATGGRHYRNEAVDQNFDTYSIEYTFDDGAKLFVGGRTIPGCFNEFASYAHGTKGSAIISTAAHTPAKCRIYSSQKMVDENLQWSFPQPEPSPYQLEWNHLMEAIRGDKPYNEIERGVMASSVASMGRMAAHTGQRITMNDFLNGTHEFAPNIDKLTVDGPAPLQADANGRYPIPEPGIKADREY